MYNERAHVLNIFSAPCSFKKCLTQQMYLVQVPTRYNVKVPLHHIYLILTPKLYNQPGEQTNVC